MIVKAPCHNCPDRYSGCHSECDKYKDYKVKLEEQKKLIEQQKQRELILFRKTKKH